MTSEGRVLHRAMSFRAQREIPMMSLLLAPSPKPNIASYCHCEPAVKRQWNDMVQEPVMLNEVKHLVLRTELCSLP